MKKERKGRLKKWLKENGKETIGKALDFVGSETDIPVLSKLIEGAGELLMNDPELSEEQKKEVAELVRLDLEELKLEQENISSRWLSDNEQESKLPKLIRPIVLGYTWIVLTLLVVLNAFGISLENVYISMFEALAITVNAAYFGARTIEKYHKNKFN
jgi:hypothetical protein